MPIEPNLLLCEEGTSGVGEEKYKRHKSYPELHFINKCQKMIDLL